MHKRLVQRLELKYRNFPKKKKVSKKMFAMLVVTNEKN